MDETQKARAVARVRITIELPLSQPWGSDAQLSDVWRTAREQAVGILERLRGRDGQGFQIMGEPEVTAIVVPEKSL